MTWGPCHNGDCIEDCFENVIWEDFNMSFDQTCNNYYSLGCCLCHNGFSGCQEIYRRLDGVHVGDALSGHLSIFKHKGRRQDSISVAPGFHIVSQKAIT